MAIILWIHPVASGLMSQPFNSLSTSRAFKYKARIHLVGSKLFLSDGLSYGQIVRRESAPVRAPSFACTNSLVLSHRY